MAKFVLGSGSPSRLQLLKQINVKPDIIAPAHINETPKKKENPLDYVKRMAESKAEALHAKYFGDVILSADTIMNYQSRIIQKPLNSEEVRELLEFYSSKNIKVITSIYMITSDNKRARKTVETTMKFKHLSKLDIDEYVAGEYGLGKAGGVAIETMMDAFIIRIIGSYSNIIGLPLYETRNMLISAGIKPNI